MVELPINKIICADCLEVLKTFPDKCIDMVLTDPPYKFETHGRGISGERAYLSADRGLKGIGVSANLDLYSDGKLLNEFVRICKKINIFIFCNKAQIPDLLNFALLKKFSFEIIALCKTAPLPRSNNQWLPDREWGIHLFSHLPVMGSYATKRGFFIDSNYQDTSIRHPSVKPLYLIQRILENLTDENDIVFDGYVGSGTTCVAAKMLGRRFIGIDISPDYCKIARERLEAVDTGVPVKEARKGQKALFPVEK